MKKTIYLIITMSLVLMAWNIRAAQNGKTNTRIEKLSKSGNMYVSFLNKADVGNLMESNGFTEEKPKTLTLIIDSYLQIKNALVSDNSGDAAKAGQKLLDAFKNFDKSTLSETQKKEYLDIEEDAVENAEHIVKNGDRISHQREHFEILSTDINDLITLLGTDKQLYRDFCPMVNNGKGAIWISEIKEIKNPFLGSKSPSCGVIQKEIK